jgi:hypothetical protein
VYCALHAWQVTFIARGLYQLRSGFAPNSGHFPAPPSGSPMDDF